MREFLKNIRLPASIGRALRAHRSLRVGMLGFTLLVTVIAQGLLETKSFPHQIIIEADGIEPSAPFPQMLSAKDKALYGQIFALQKKKEWQQAGELASHISNPILMGTIKAEKYLSDQYTSSYAELKNWLSKYADHPQAHKIYTLALNKKPPGERLRMRIASPTLLRGYGDDNGLAQRRETALLDNASWDNAAAGQLWKKLRAQLKSDKVKEAAGLLQAAPAKKLFSQSEYDIAQWNVAHAYFTRGNNRQAYDLANRAAARSGNIIPGIHWVAGLAAWKLGDEASAAKHFEAMAAGSELLSPWETAAASFWAYRANTRLGRHIPAKTYLEQAAEESRTFYGIIARRALNESLELDLADTGLGGNELDDLITIPAVARSIALVEAGKNEMAELELRALFPDSNQEIRGNLLRIARALDLPAVQIPMARVLAKDGRAYDFASYPLPAWQPRAGFELDPALLFAFARQESGFHPKAQSGDGARGLMQIMPKTARYLAKHHEPDLVWNRGDFNLRLLEEPVANLSLGQSYIAHLMRQNYVQGNLFFLAAAYNAGPGKLLEWKKSLDYRHDPLLFLESIPYSETRNYVTQVVANYWIYSEIITGKPISLAILLQGGWPQYAGNTLQLASAQ